MGLISAIRAVLGMGDADGRSGGDTGTNVTVEREADTTGERAPKESDATRASTEDDPGTATGEGADRAAEDDPASEPGSGDGGSVEEIRGIGPTYGERLADAGIHTVSDLAAADAAELCAATGIEEGRIEGWIERAAEH